MFSFAKSSCILLCQPQTFVAVHFEPQKVNLQCTRKHDNVEKFQLPSFYCLGMKFFLIFLGRLSDYHLQCCLIPL